MIVLNFEVKKQRIIKKNTEYLVNHSSHFLKFDFIFDDQWDLFSPKYIIFKYNEKNYLNILTFDTDLAKHTIEVPSVVLKGSSFRFTIYGLLYVGGNEERITTQEVTIKLHDSGFTTKFSNILDDNDNVDIFTTLHNEISSKFDDLIIEGDNIICKSEGTIIKIIPLSVFLDDYYNRSETDILFDGKANNVHTHVTSEVLDFEDKVDIDLDTLLVNLTENIRTM